MSIGTLGRRRALSGGLATALTVATGVDGTEEISSANRGHQDQGADEANDSHAQLHAALLDWLGMASGRLALPVSVGMPSPSRTELRIKGVHPAITVLLQRGCDCSAWIEWGGICWDSWLWLDVYSQPVTDGWVNTLVLEEYRVVHPTLKSLWRADMFEPLLDWINDDLTHATHVAMLGGAGRASWARLVRNGKFLGTNWTIEEDGRGLAHLLPIHGYAA